MAKPEPVSSANGLGARSPLWFTSLLRNKVSRSWDKPGQNELCCSPRARGFRQDFAMNNTEPLAQIDGNIILIGAGKMGGAMLSGWLAQGLDARRVAVIEPSPSVEITELAAKGVRFNLSPADTGAVAAV